MTDGSPIDVNTATAEELDGVPSLRGQGFAIMRYREERGRFTDLRRSPAIASPMRLLCNAGATRSERR